MKKKIVSLLTICVLVAGSGISALASEPTKEVVENSYDTSSARDSIAPQSVSDAGGFWVNGKYYSCSTSFCWTKSSNTLYYGGMKSTTAANTKREYSLTVKANTTANGYITYSGKGSNTGTNTLSQSRLITVQQALDTPNYKSWAGSCKIYYGSTLKWTGAVYN